MRRAMIVVAALVPLACADLSMNPVTRQYDRVVVNPSFALDIVPVLRETCGSSGACHGLPTGQRGLVLEGSDSAIYAHIVNVASELQPAMLRVTPGDPNNSLLFLLLSDTASVRLGERRMPLTRDPLPQTIRSTIKNWILTGAPNN